MDASLISPFLNATTHVIGTMCQLEVVAGSPEVKHGTGTWGEVTGIIGMSSEQLSGNMLVSFDEAAVLAIVSNMLMDKFTEINAEIVDAVGEITNMITGGAKQQLAEMGHQFSMATPIVVQGKGINLVQLSKAPVIQIPFVLPEGKFVLEANLSEATER